MLLYKYLKDILAAVMDYVKLFGAIRQDIKDLREHQDQSLNKGFTIVSDRLASQAQQLIAQGQLLVRQDERLSAQAQMLISQAQQLAEIAAVVVPLPAVSMDLEVELEGQITEGEDRMEKSIQNTQKLVVRILKFKNKKGGDAAVDGIPGWASADETSVVVNPSPDGMSAELVAVGPVSAAGSPTRVVISADADLGEGVKPIFGEVLVTVTPGEATQIELEADAPVDQ